MLENLFCFVARALAYFDQTNSKPVAFNQSNTFINQEYLDNQTSTYDIVLIKLPEPVPDSEYIRPICLPSEDQCGDTLMSDPSQHCQRITSIGWNEAEVSASHKNIPEKTFNNVAVIKCPTYMDFPRSFICGIKSLPTGIQEPSLG